MKTTKHFALAAVLGIAVAVVLGTPSVATAGKWYIKPVTFDNVGDEPHAAGWWGVDLPYQRLLMSFRGLTPGADYFAVNSAGEYVAFFTAGGNGKADLMLWPPYLWPFAVYRDEATGPVLVLESPWPSP